MGTWDTAVIGSVGSTFPPASDDRNPATKSSCRRGGRNSEEQCSRRTLLLRGGRAAGLQPKAFNCRNTERRSKSSIYAVTGARERLGRRFPKTNESTRMPTTRITIIIRRSIQRRSERSFRYCLSTVRRITINRPPSGCARRTPSPASRPPTKLGIAIRGESLLLVGAHHRPARSSGGAWSTPVISPLAIDGAAPRTTTKWAIACSESWNNRMASGKPGHGIARPAMRI